MTHNAFRANYPSPWVGLEAMSIVDQSIINLHNAILIVHAFWPMHQLSALVRFNVMDTREISLAL
jgi:hypothetical protein